MKKIMYAGLTVDTTQDSTIYRTTEISEAEYGEEWDGDVEGYIYNAAEDVDRIEVYNVDDDSTDFYHPNYGNVVGSVYIVYYDGAPSELYWCVEEAATYAIYGKDVHGRRPYEDINDNAYWRDKLSDALDFARELAAEEGETVEIAKFEDGELAWDHYIEVDPNGDAWSDDWAARDEMGCIQ